MAVTTCDGCGACCMGQNLLPLTGAGLDGRRLPDVLQFRLTAIIEGPLSGDDYCPCVWLDRATGRCNHHDHRPSICREFHVGGEDCLRIRAKGGG